MRRREFLQQNLRLLSLGLLPGSFLLSCTRGGGSGGGIGRVGTLMSASHVPGPGGRGTMFYYYDLARERIEEIATPLDFPHMALGFPGRRNLVLVPESGGENACVIDLVEKRVVKELKAHSGRVFGGHAVFSADGKSLFCSEFEPAPSGKGFVAEWNPATLEKVRAFPTGGRFPHDVALQDGGRVLTASNLGVEEGKHVKSSGTFVSKIELASGKLLERVELNDIESEIDPSPIAGGESLAAADEVMRTDARYFISYMQVANPEFRVFLYAHSHRPVVTLWDIPQRRLVKEFRFDEQPRALVVTFNRSHVAVVLASGRVRFLDLKQKRVDDSLQARLLLPVTTHVNHWWDPATPPPAKEGQGGTYSWDPAPRVFA